MQKGGTLHRGQLEVILAALAFAVSVPASKVLLADVGPREPKRSFEIDLEKQVRTLAGQMATYAPLTLEPSSHRSCSSSGSAR